MLNETLKSMRNLVTTSGADVDPIETNTAYEPGNEEYDSDAKEQNVGLPKSAVVKLFASTVLLVALAMAMVREVPRRSCTGPPRPPPSANSISFSPI